MSSLITRRRALAITGATLASAALDPLGRHSNAYAADNTLNVVWWGGPWIESMQKVIAKSNQFDVKWELHVGGAAAVMAKIKAAWPRPTYDVVGQFTPLFYTWMREGWPEPLTYEEVPNLKNVPEALLVKDQAGNIINAPMSQSGIFWGYRKDTCPVPVKRLEDLLDPRLKGQIVCRDPQALNGQVVSFALEFGGDDKSMANLEPGWDFLKRLAKAGNIGRVEHSDVDFVNSLTSGECSIGFSNLGAWSRIAASVPCEFLTKVPGSRGMKTFQVVEGAMIPKNSTHKALAKQFVNFLLGTENNQLYNEGVGMAPTNINSRPGKFAESIQFKTKGDIEAYTYTFNYPLLSQIQSEMSKKFETEIKPLL